MCCLCEAPLLFSLICLAGELLLLLLLLLLLGLMPAGLQVTQNLDPEGHIRVASLLKGMRQSTVLLVAQADTPNAQVYKAPARSHAYLVHRA